MKILKKKKESNAGPSNGFVLNIKGDLTRLEKGMSKQDVLAILGEPLRIEECSGEFNEKMIFKLYSNGHTSNRYSVLFTSNTLVYIAKLK